MCLLTRSPFVNQKIKNEKFFLLGSNRWVRFDVRMLSQLIGMAKDQGASDLHIEAGLPPAIRVRGSLKTLDQPMSARDTQDMAQSLLSADQWQQFLLRRSADLSRSLHGIRCRINVLQTSRGVGLAVRLLPGSAVTLDSLNLHPDFRRLVHPSNGLLIVTGSTGSGKSSTVAALVEEINQTENRHIVTLESPIEFFHRPKRSYLRQREVGRDTPSFEQGLLDALREDPDVLVVGEMRDPETMRLTLNAAETGHLVITTMHSGTAVEALQRMVSSFAPETQSAIRAQLADCLVGVLAQRLRYRPEIKTRVPECELLVPSHAIRVHIRGGEYHKIAASQETGAEHGMWTFPRYNQWLENRKTWSVPMASRAEDDEDVLSSPSTLPPLPVSPPTPHASDVRSPSLSPSTRPAAPTTGRIEIEPEAGGLGELLKKLKGD